MSLSDDPAHGVLVSDSADKSRAPGASPDWENIEFKVACSRCAYNLRMLQVPRCPECGLEFDWQDVLDKARWQSDFLFEHHWHRSPIRSYLRTFLRSLRPGRFWSHVSIHEHPSAGALWVYFILAHLWLFTSFVVVFSAAAWLLLGVAHLLGRHQSALADSVYGYGVSLQNLGKDFFDPDSGGFAWILLLLPPWGAMAALYGLRQTLARCRLRGIHMLRIVAYVSPPLFIVWSCVLLAMSMWQMLFEGSTSPIAFVVYSVGGIVGYLGPPVIFLTAGTRSYARLPRARFVGFTIAFVACLFAFTLAILWDLRVVSGM